MKNLNPISVKTPEFKRYRLVTSPIYLYNTEKIDYYDIAFISAL